jgi:long-chain acyl-CoA synthetase
LTGLTESCAGCFTAIGDVFSMMGTVGIPMTTIEARLESVPEMGYDALSSEPRGEICLRGNSLFSGYHKRQDLTEEVMVDGWFHTGIFDCFLVTEVLVRPSLRDSSFYIVSKCNMFR